MIGVVGLVLLFEQLSIGSLVWYWNVSGKYKGKIILVLGVQSDRPYQAIKICVFMAAKLVKTSFKANDNYLWPPLCSYTYLNALQKPSC